MNRLHDLLFVIGLFLTIIGGIVLVTGIVGPSDLVQGVRVNLLGGGVITVIGISMILGSILRKSTN